MTTLAPPLMKASVKGWEDTYPSAVFSGIVGDAAHFARGGYHISIEDQPATNYSVVRVGDKAPPGTWPRNLAAGLDISMAVADMKRSYARWRRVFDDRTDPRRVFFNAFNGWDGVGEAKRCDFVTGTVSVASPDHEGHQHTEWKRKYVNDPEAYRAAASINAGQTKEEYMTGVDPNNWDVSDDVALHAVADRYGYGAVRGMSEIPTKWDPKNPNGTEKHWEVITLKEIKAEQEAQGKTLAAILKKLEDLPAGSGLTEAQVDARIAGTTLRPPVDPEG